MPIEENEYTKKLKKLEKIDQLKQQRDSDSGQVKRNVGSPNSGGLQMPYQNGKHFSIISTFSSLT